MMQPSIIGSPAGAVSPPHAGLFGRLLRLALGALLLASIAGFYLRGSASFALSAAGVVVGLALLGLLTHRLLVRAAGRTGAWTRSCVALAPLVLVYLLGIGGGPIFGRGEGQLGALTFLGLSLVAAALTADPGCELLALPNLLSRRPVRAACLLFSPLDALERRLAARRAGRHGAAPFESGRRPEETRKR